MVGQFVDDAAHLNIVSGGQGVAGHSGANGAELKFVAGLTAHSASCVRLRCKTDHARQGVASPGVHLRCGEPGRSCLLVCKGLEVLHAVYVVRLHELEHRVHPCTLLAAPVALAQHRLAARAARSALGAHLEQFCQRLAARMQAR